MFDTVCSQYTVLQNMYLCLIWAYFPNVFLTLGALSHGWIIRLGFTYPEIDVTHDGWFFQKLKNYEKWKEIQKSLPNGNLNQYAYWSWSRRAKRVEEPLKCSLARQMLANIDRFWGSSAERKRSNFKLICFGFAERSDVFLSDYHSIPWTDQIGKNRPSLAKKDAYWLMFIYRYTFTVPNTGICTPHNLRALQSLDCCIGRPFSKD